MKPSWRSWANRVLLEPCWANYLNGATRPPDTDLGPLGQLVAIEPSWGRWANILGVGPQSHLGANWANILVGPQSHLELTGPTSLLGHRAIFGPLGQQPCWATEPSWDRAPPTLPGSGATPDPNLLTRDEVHKGKYYHNPCHLPGPTGLRARVRPYTGSIKSKSCHPPLTVHGRSHVRISTNWALGSPSSWALGRTSTFL